MRMQPETIRLGSHEWLVRPLTLRQVQEIEPFLLESTLGSRGNVGAAIAIVAIALSREHPEAASVLQDVEATALDIGEAMATVLRLGGFIESCGRGDETPGEAVAGAVQTMDPPASTSDSSMLV